MPTVSDLIPEFSLTNETYRVADLQSRKGQHEFVHRECLSHSNAAVVHVLAGRFVCIGSIVIGYRVPPTEESLLNSVSSGDRAITGPSLGHEHPDQHSPRTPQRYIAIATRHVAGRGLNEYRCFKLTDQHQYNRHAGRKQIVNIVACLPGDAFSRGASLEYFAGQECDSNGCVPTSLPILSDGSADEAFASPNINGFAASINIARSFADVANILFARDSFVMSFLDDSASRAFVNFPVARWYSSENRSFSIG